MFLLLFVYLLACLIACLFVCLFVVFLLISILSEPVGVKNRNMFVWLSYVFGQYFALLHKVCVLMSTEYKR